MTCFAPLDNKVFRFIMRLSIMLNTTNESRLITTLEDSGYRITGPRKDVFALLDRKSEGFTAEEICTELPQVGRATIYRTIRLLLNAEVICKLALPDGTPRYSIARFGHHHHTICVACGSVSDFRGLSLERILRSIGQEIEGDILEHRIELYVMCRSCLNTTK